MRTAIYLILFIFISYSEILAQRSNKSAVEKLSKSVFEETTLTGLKFRSIGPAQTSGRVSDFAINPNNFKDHSISPTIIHMGSTVHRKPRVTAHSRHAWQRVVFDTWVGCGGVERQHEILCILARCSHSVVASKNHKGKLGRHHVEKS